MDSKKIQQLIIKISEGLNLDSIIVAETFKTALRHSSVAQGQNYERLEFLGDRALGLTIAQNLLKTYPKSNEGDLAKRYAVLVCQDTLNKIGLELEVDCAVEIIGNQVSVSIRADIVEAIIGYLHLYHGYEAAERFIQIHWSKRISELQSTPENPRSILQEWTMQHKLPPPYYQEVSRGGTDHAPQFIFSVSIPSLGAAQGIGSSKQEAKRQAAQLFLKKFLSLHI